MRAVAVVTAAIAGLALASCAGDDGVRTVRGDWYGYSPQYLQYAATRGSLPTIVAGSAVADLSKPDFDRRVLDEMSGRPLGVGPIRFEPMATGGETPALFVSLVFNPEPGFGEYQACYPAAASAGGRAARPDGSTRVVAAFCSSQHLLSSTVAEADGLNGAADPRFGELIRLVMIDLFPPHDPKIGPNIPSCGNCP